MRRIPPALTPLLSALSAVLCLGLGPLATASAQPAAGGGLPTSAPAPGAATPAAPLGPEVAPESGSETETETGSAADGGTTARAAEPGEMSHAEVVEYFRELRRFHRHRYDRPWTVAVQLGHGWAIDHAGVNPYRLLLGGAAGYTFPLYDVYLGVSGAYHGGDTLPPSPGQKARGLRAGTYKGGRISVDFGPEFIFRRARLRALASGGSLAVSGPRNTVIAPVLGLGVGLLVPFGPAFVGADYRIDFLLGQDEVATHLTSLAASAGFRF